MFKLSKEYIYFLFLMIGILLRPSPVLSQGAMLPPDEDVSIQYKELFIGKKVPNIKFQAINHSSNTIELSDFPGKLILLDFWGTWCTPCIKKIPFLDSLQEKLGEKLQIILVHANNNVAIENISEYLKNYEKVNKRKLRLPIAVFDSVAKNIFPYRIIPHMVWIDKDRIFRGATNGSEVNSNFIDSMYAGFPISFHFKKDILNFNRELPLFYNENGGEERDVIWKTVMTGNLEGVPSGRFMNLDSGKISHFAIRNYTALNLYKIAHQVYLPQSQTAFEMENKKGFIYERKDNNWLQNNTYCYEVIAPKMKLNGFLKNMKRDLLGYFGVVGKVEVRPVKCIIITNLEPGIEKKKVKQHLKNGKKLDDEIATIAELLADLNQFGNTPVFSEVSMNKYVNFPMKQDVWDLDILKQKLNENGLDFKYVTKDLKIFVLFNSTDE